DSVLPFIVPVLTFHFRVFECFLHYRFHWCHFISHPHFYYAECFYGQFFHPFRGGCTMPDLSKVRSTYVFTFFFTSLLKPSLFCKYRTILCKGGPQSRPRKGMKNGAFILAIQDSLR